MPTLTCNGVDLYYERRGDGPPLTLIMGLGCSARQWRWMAEPLSRGFHLIALDNRGAGRSEKPAEDYTVDQLADDVAALWDQLGVERSHVFGASMGGMVAQALALDHADRVERLVLGCTMPAFGCVSPSDETIGQMAAAGSPEVPAEQGVDGMLRLFLSADFRAREPARAAALREVMIEEKREQGPDAFMRQFAAMCSYDRQAELGRVAAPTLVLAGDADPVVPLGNAERLAEAIAGAALAVRPGVSHAFWVEDAEGCAARVADFLGR